MSPEASPTRAVDYTPREDREAREELVYKLLGLLKGLVSMFPVPGLLKVVGMALVVSMESIQPAWQI